VRGGGSCVRKRQLARFRGRVGGAGENSDGDDAFNPATDTEEARNFVTNDVYLSVQGRGCMISNRQLYDIVALNLYARNSTIRSQCDARL
jgi:hypothetical protein